MAPAAPAFAKDERVLCFHQELLYEANILDVRLEDPKDRKGPHEYKVHYRGWKKTWDGWVPQDRLKKWSEENQELAKTLKKEMETLTQQQRPKTSASSKKKGDSSARDSEERAMAGRKRGRDYDTEKEDAYQSKPAIRIIMPDVLKSILVDDWENITKNLQLVHIPAEEFTVSRVLNEYYDYEKAHRGAASAAANILEEIVAGLIEYFNKSLGRLLLYRFERGQYEDVLARVNKSGDELEGRPLADIYGCEHLLRLLVSLPELIAQTNMDQQSVTRLREELHGLTAWLSRQENINKFLATPYENQGSEYQERIILVIDHAFALLTIMGQMDIFPKDKGTPTVAEASALLLTKKASVSSASRKLDVTEQNSATKGARDNRTQDIRAGHKAAGRHDRSAPSALSPGKSARKKTYQRSMQELDAVPRTMASRPKLSSDQATTDHHEGQKSRKVQDVHGIKIKLKREEAAPKGRLASSSRLADSDDAGGRRSKQEAHVEAATEKGRRSRRERKSVMFASEG